MKFPLFGDYVTHVLLAGSPQPRQSHGSEEGSEKWRLDPVIRREPPPEMGTKDSGDERSGRYLLGQPRSGFPWSPVAHCT